jgi:glycerophosphoryl diester phosphodiesterase
MATPPACFAHRGLSSERTENTLAAFRAAADAGFQGVELDLQMTRDRELIVLHDDDLVRVTGLDAEASEVDYDNVAGHPTRDGPVPRLKDLFAAMADWQGWWNLEVKAKTAIEPALELVNTFGLGARTIVSCMDSEPLHVAQEANPEIARALITLGWPDEADVEVAQALDCTWVNADHEFLDHDAVKHVKAAGLKLGAWTVNEPERARELLGWGVEAVITDRREVLMGLKTLKA